MYKVLKTSTSGKSYWVNDSEGMPMEFDTPEQAQQIADLFQANTTHNSIYVVKRVGER